MSLKCGIIGLPNIGKSTLFNALTQAAIATGNFPFTTIERNRSIVSIPDYRLTQLFDIIKSQRVVPTNIEFVDIAGLVPGASKGEGLGNKFLTHIRETDAICHMVRCFNNDDIIHVNGCVNPIEDIEIINTELILADLEVCERAIARVEKRIKMGYKNLILEFSVLEKCLLHLSNSNILRTLNLSFEEKEVIRYLRFLTIKPTMYVANVNEYGFYKNHYLDQLCKIADNEGSWVITVCATVESEISKLEKEERERFMIELNMEDTGLNNIIRQGYQLLNLQTYFTVSKKEIRAWTISVGTTAQQAAGKIHSDLEKGFIRAKTISFKDFIKCNGEQNAKKAGKIRLEGRKYIVQDGDVMHFLYHNK